MRASGLIYLIRHAESTFNFEADIELLSDTTLTKQSPEYLALKFDPKYMDCGLTAKGRQQCQATREELAGVEFGLVLVSPMRRAIETCFEIFRDHPSRPKIVVEPGVREIFSSSCDIGTRVGESMKEFGELMNFGAIKNSSEFWYIDSIKDKKIREEIMGDLQKLASKQSINLDKPRTPSEASILSTLSSTLLLNYLQNNRASITQKTFSNFTAQK